MILMSMPDCGMQASSPGMASRSVVELDWWQETMVRGDLWITAVPAQHFSGRGLLDRDRRLWCGFIVQTEGACIYFAGDTGVGPHIAAIAQKFPQIDVAILPIGAYRPQWFMGEMHMSPQEAVAAHLELGARVSFASHFGTFDLADDGQDEPLEALHEVLQRTNLGRTKLWALGFGEACDVAPRSEGVRQHEEIAGD